MPGLNRKGPEGQGPRSGRGLGKCDSENGLRGSGRGLGRRKGMGRRCGSQHEKPIDNEG